jgi:hypothetical protein
LKSQKTDTDQLNAIEALLDVLDEHAGQGWADEQAQSGFGKKAAGTVKELNEAIVANKALSEAREVRARSYGPAYERYLRFKRVVRDALGSTSKQYKRIHLRGAVAGAAAEAEEVGGGGAAGCGRDRDADVREEGRPPGSGATGARRSPTCGVRATRVFTAQLFGRGGHGAERHY